MPTETTKSWGASDQHRDSFSFALGKLLAVGIILAPPAMMLFSELNHRSGSTSRGTQDASTVSEPAPAPALILEPYGKCGK
jgi:hypothetical protein